MAETKRETNALVVGTLKVLRRRGLWLLGIIGVNGVGDLFKEYVRGKVMDYAISRLSMIGPFGDFLIANPFAFTSIGIVLAMISLTALVVAESVKETPSAIYEHRDKPFTHPPVPGSWVAIFLAAMVVLIAGCCFGTYKYWLHTSRRIDPNISAKTPVNIVPFTPPPAPSPKVTHLGKAKPSALPLSSVPQPATNEGHGTVESPENSLAYIPPSVDNMRDMIRAFNAFKLALGPNTPVLIKLTATQDTMQMARDMSAFATDDGSKIPCKFRVEGPDSLDYPTPEKEAMDGMIPGKLVVHMATDLKGADGLFESLKFRIKAKWKDDPPKSDKENIVWLQFGTGLRWNN